MGRSDSLCTGRTSEQLLQRTTARAVVAVESIAAGGPARDGQLAAGRPSTLLQQRRPTPSECIAAGANSFARGRQPYCACAVGWLADLDFGFLLRNDNFLRSDTRRSVRKMYFNAGSPSLIKFRDFDFLEERHPADHHLLTSFIPCLHG